jgi:S-adenosylmethionine hydrolase
LDDHEPLISVLDLEVTGQHLRDTQNECSTSVIIKQSTPKGQYSLNYTSPTGLRQPKIIGTIESMNNQPIITLLTDFGLSDAYVGTMKGVILSYCPRTQLIDLTHDIQPQNIRQAAYVLLTAFRYFPPHTVFLVVVDPGVGTEREPIAVVTNYGTYVAPNNGVLSYILPHVQVQHTAVIQNADYFFPNASRTFHGRDIFSPAAAHLANGVPVTELGPAVPELVKLPDPLLDINPGRIAGQVLHIDHFGNIITSIGSLTWQSPDTLQLSPQFGSQVPIEISAPTCRVLIGTEIIQSIRPTYGTVDPGALVALVGSSGQLEIGINQGNAAQTLEVKLNDRVTLDFEDFDTPQNL